MANNKNIFLVEETRVLISYPKLFFFDKLDFLAKIECLTSYRFNELVMNELPLSVTQQSRGTNGVASLSRN
jgi:hypothetical protein